MNRIGFGSDIHQLAANRPLILGGVEIESDLGAEGHSDADAFTHAVTDAIFGALGLGDIGSHFPNSEERWLNAERGVFLRYAGGVMKEYGYEIENFDTVVHLESPKLRPYIDKMRASLANALEIEQNQISIKAKTGEEVDAVGERCAVKAEAIALLRNLAAE